MKLKSLLIVCILVFNLLFPVSLPINFKITTNEKANNIKNDTITQSESDSVFLNDNAMKKNANLLASTQEQTITMQQFANLLKNKKEHYPFSDEFIEKYQQTSGGYIENAKKAGLTVDRTKHEPNQKWHFFDSWLYPSIEDGSLTYDESAKSRVYSKLLCPELLLWIYEACGVQPEKVKNAMTVAQQGKTNGLSVSTIAKNMRGCVSWEDLLVAFNDSVSATSVTLNNTQLTLTVGESDKTLIAEVQPANTTDSPIWTITQGSDCISISQNGNQVTVHPIKSGSATIKVVYNMNVYQQCTINVLGGESVTNCLITLGKHENSKVFVDNVEFIGSKTIASGQTFNFRVDANAGYEVQFVKANDTILTCNNDVYSFVVTKNCEITVTTIISSIVTSPTNLYNVVYDLGTRLTAKQINDATELFNAFSPMGTSNIVKSITYLEYIYGGANGGSNENKWYSGNIIKIGTTSVNGKMTFQLNSKINYVKITGYVYDCKSVIRVGDSLSTDWGDDATANDNKTTLFTCTDMNEASKTVVENKQASTILVKFSDTDSLTIATTNRKPLFITNIEFGFDNTL